MLKSMRFNVTYLLIAVLGVFLVHDAWVVNQTVASIPYSEFQRLLREKKVKEVGITANQVYGELTAPENGRSKFVAARVDAELSRELDQHGVKYAAHVESTLLPTLLSWVVPVLMFFAVWILLGRFMASRMGGGSGLMSIGKSKAKVYVENDTKVTFKDVAGVDEVHPRSRWHRSTRSVALQELEPC